MKRKKSGGGGANWMDTYGDMVTLLLCFFVLLFSMSTLDKEKMIQLVKAFNPDAIVEQPIGYGDDGLNEEAPEGMTQDEVDQALQKLYAALDAYAKEQNEQMAAQGMPGKGISVTLGSGYVFISLNDAVFFNGESYELLDGGKAVLDRVGEMLAPVSGSINELRVLGHTAQATMNNPNRPTWDRILSANRAAVVLAYMQEMDFLDPARMVSLGYGQWRPISPNDTAEERAKNRRVEMIVSGIKVDEPEQDTIASYYTSRKTEPPATPAAPAQ